MNVGIRRCRDATHSSRFARLVVLPFWLTVVEVLVLVVAEEVAFAVAEAEVDEVPLGKVEYTLEKTGVLATISTMR